MLWVKAVEGSPNDGGSEVTMGQQKATTPPAPDADRNGAGGAHAHDIRDTLVTVIMSGPVIAVRTDVCLDVVLTTFAINHVRHLAVVDEVGRCTGMITDREVTARWAMRPTTFAHTRVSEVCEGPTPVATPRATLAEVAGVLRNCATDAVVILDEAGRPLGVVTTSDLVAVIACPHLG
jgi:CBS-domain-containing membrane protein